jgi:beta-carotene 15,15'-dioxygenase
MQKYILLFIKTPTLITVLISILLLIFQFIFGSFSDNIQHTIFIIFILFTGIPHGALDHLIQEQNDNLAFKKYNIYRFLAKYIFIMLLYGLLWFFFAKLSFLIFLLISAWHFGETDLENIPKNVPIWNFVSIIYGAYLLAFIFLIHFNEAKLIIQQMILIKESNSNLLIKIEQNRHMILYLLGLSFGTIFIIAQSVQEVSFDLKRIARLLIILFCSIWLPLIPAFALYFGGWHALCAFDHIYQYVKKDFSNHSFSYYYLKAIPFTLLAFIFLAAFHWFCKNYTLHINAFAILFIFISLITLPHLIIFHKMDFSSKKNV